MPTCPAIKANGEICGKFGRFYQGHCGIHHNSKLSRDPAYLAEYEAYKEQAHRRQEEEHEAVTQRTAERERARIARRAAEQAEEERQRAEHRANHIAKNLRKVELAPSYSPTNIMVCANKIATLWNDNNIPEYYVMKAYAALKYTSSAHVGFPGLIRAAVSLICLGFGNHPDHASYSSVSEHERMTALAGIRDSLVPYGEINLDQLIPGNDKYIPSIIARRRREEEARRIEEERLRREQFAIDLRERPVVFQRDPEGSINLAAFATDNQSVHRSSVQNTTHKMVLAILQRPLIEGQDTLVELVQEFNNPRIVRWSSVMRDNTITELTNDYYNTEAFSLIYGDVLDHVWAYIRPHTHRDDLVVRLAQELSEGLGMCSNGKMARLMNTLQGYDDTLEQDVPKELFQNKIALLTTLPVAERETAARALFDEYHIAQEEHAVWLEPLLEA